MAKITHSDVAPAESVHYTLVDGTGGTTEFDLGGRTKSFTPKSYDATLFGNADAHPWLKVEREEAEVVEGAFREQIAPSEDPLSAVNSRANDPEAARAALAEAESAQPVAIDSGETQTKVVEVGPIAETLAADDSSKTSDKKDKS